MNVLMLSPGFPAEMPLFTRALAEAGATVIGLGAQSEDQMDPELRRVLSGFIQVPSWGENDILAALRSWSGAPIESVECLWEPGVMMAALIREALDLPGMTVDQSIVFRDKEEMKRALDQAGIRTPRHEKAATVTQCRQAAERIGFPLILKPIAGAGSMDTFEVHDVAELEQTLPKLAHVESVSVEEFIEGEEHTFDTICRDGSILFSNVAWYRPRALVARSNEWISPQTVALRDIETEELRPGRDVGVAVLEALQFHTGFTHMEWFRRPDGEAVFVEIACRPPGARSVDLMNQVCDRSLFHGWAEAVVSGEISEPFERKFNAAVIFKRAQGQGYIRRIEGLERLRDDLGDALVAVDLLPLGAPRRNWRHTLLSDGFVTVRHPELQPLLEIADRVGTDLGIYAG